MTPEPFEYDPFEMDWPWPGMHTPEAEPAATTPPAAKTDAPAPPAAQPPQSVTPRP